MVDDVFINKAAAIARAVRPIGKEYEGDDASLTANQTRQDAMILNLQRACESSIDAGMHLVAHACIRGRPCRSTGGRGRRR